MLEVAVRFWGDFACFTRLELKVERLSYPVMTPSAARGVLDAILFKPQMAWHVRRITVLEPWWLPSDSGHPPYRQVGIRRNEITECISPRNVAAWMKQSDQFQPCFVDSAGKASPFGETRTQRNTLALRDVAYLIHATPVLTARANRPRVKPPEHDEPQGPDTEVKYAEMFRRRVAKGQCFHHPYLGCREFACSFAAPDGSERPVAWTEPLGLMLYDIYFGRAGANLPGFFQADIKNGVLHCDTRERGPEGESPINVIGWPEDVPS